MRTVRNWAMFSRLKCQAFRTSGECGWRCERSLAARPCRPPSCQMQACSLHIPDREHAFYFLNRIWSCLEPWYTFVWKTSRWPTQLIWNLHTSKTGQGMYSYTYVIYTIRVPSFEDSCRQLLVHCGQIKASLEIEVKMLRDSVFISIGIMGNCHTSDFLQWVYFCNKIFLVYERADFVIWTYLVFGLWAYQFFSK